jgi:gliding motility-associated-like protein
MKSYIPMKLSRNFKMWAIAVLSILSLASQVQASHVFGGEITWRAVRDNNPQNFRRDGYGFIFIMTVYRDCSGIPMNGLTPSMSVQGNPVDKFGSVVNSISLNPAPGRLGTGYEITPICGGSTNITRCGAGNPLGGTGSPGAIAAVQFWSDTIWLTGVPPSTGWLFQSSAGAIPCCRNTNANTSCAGDMILRARMLPYFVQGPLGQQVGLNVQTMGDGSPEFAEAPAATTVQNPSTTDTVIYNNNAVDFDLDFTRYWIDNPFSGLNAPCNYNRGYTILNPMPGIVRPYGPGISAIDTLTGELRFLPQTQGNFLLCIRVESYRGTQKIAEVFRDFQSVTIPNSPGLGYNAIQSPPVVTAPYKTPTGQPSYSGSYFVGDNIEFGVRAVDFAPFTDSVYLFFNKNPVFGAFIPGPDTLRADSGCVRPPCAVIKATQTGSSITRMSLNGVEIGYGLGRRNATQMTFSWQTGCGNIRTITTQGNQAFIDKGNYSFNLTAKDNQCPFNGRVVKSLNIELLNIPKIAPTPRGLKLVSNGILINFGSLIDVVNKEPQDSLLFTSIKRRAKNLKQIQVFRNSCNTGFTRVKTIVPPSNLNDTALVHWFFNFREWVDTFAVNPTCKHEYYFRVVAGCDTTPSDTSAHYTLLENFVVNQSGSANVTWNGITKSPPSGTGGKYIIQRKIGSNPVAPWVNVDSVPANIFNYLEPIIVCDDTVFYRILYRENIPLLRDTSFIIDTCLNPNLLNTILTGRWAIKRPEFLNPLKLDNCRNQYFIIAVDTVSIESFGIPRGARFQDIQAPSTLNWRFVSVDTTNINQDLLLKTDTTAALDFDEYEFFIVNGGSFSPIGKDLIKNRGFLRDPNRSGATASHTYTVVARDSCNNTSPMSDALASSFLQGVVNTCGGRIELTWNIPTNWAGGIKEVKVMRNDNNVWVPVATLPATATTYSDNNNLIEGNYYCYSIWVVNNVDTTIIANSNQTCIRADIIRKPKDLYIRYASVDTLSQKVKLAWIIDSTAELKSFIIERNSGSGFTQIANIAAVNPSGTVRQFFEFTYVDSSAEVNATSHVYRVKSIDPCDSIFTSVNSAKTILLTGQALGNFTNTMTWNEYLDWINGVKEYEVLRNIPANSTAFSSVIAKPITDRSFIDDVFLLEDNDGNFCYIIKAVENGINKYGLIDTAFSNRLCVTQEPRLFVPNVIAPDGLNNKFYPKGTYINKKSNYRMEIFNRWGEKIYETTNFEDGWDGTFKGSIVQHGMYIYIINFQDANGRNLTKKGYFQIID